MVSEHPETSNFELLHVLQNSATVISLANLNGSPPYLLYSVHTAVYLKGQTYIDTSGSYTWTMDIWGGNGTITNVLWQYSTDGGATYVPVGTSTYYTRYVYAGDPADPSFRLRASFTSGADAPSAVIDVNVATCQSDTGC